MKRLKQVTNPKEMILVLIGIIFSAEFFIHSLILPWAGASNSAKIAALLDAFMLVIVLIPAMFLLIYKPLAHEILKRKKIEEEYRVIFEHSPNAILAVVDETGKIVNVNPQAERAFGYTKYEFLDKNVECLMPERFRDKHRIYRSEFMKSPKARPMGVGRDLRGLRKDGSEFPIEIALTPANIDGKIAILTTITDITIRKSIEMQRDEAIEGGRVGLWDWNFKTNQLHWSDRCKELFQIKSDIELSYEVFLNTISPLDRDRVDKEFKKALEEKKPFEIEMRIIFPHGKVHWILLKGRAYDDPYGKVARMSGAVLDITEQKRATILRDEVIAIVSHDLKNPLTSIDLNISLLKKLRPNDELVAKQTQNILHTTKQMNRLLTDLLDVSRLESGRIEIHPKEQLVQPIAEEVLTIVSPLLNEKCITIAMAQKYCEHKAFIDHDRMVQVFSNIIGNAIKFTPKGGCISMKCQGGIEGLTIIISDTGQGIAAEELPHVFDRFWQAKQTQRAGAGLGLAIVKGIIEAHGGKIWIESELGKGTTVSFTIPNVSNK